MPLHKAVKIKNSQIVSILLNREDVNINAKDEIRSKNSNKISLLN